MLENYLGYLEICMQLYANENGTKEIADCFEKYDNLLNQEYNELSSEEKELLKELINSKMTHLKMERSAIAVAQIITQKDKKLDAVFPGHIKAQYSDKLKKYQRELHFLEVEAERINRSQGMSK